MAQVRFQSGTSRRVPPGDGGFDSHRVRAFYRDTGLLRQVFSVMAISGLMNNTLRWSAYLKECLEGVLGLGRLQVRNLAALLGGSSAQ